MFTHLLASALVAFQLLPNTVEPSGSSTSIYVTRAEAAAALLLARNPNVTVTKNMGQFPDVHSGDWFGPYMLAAQKAGIVTADSVTHKLNPNATVNRSQFLKMLAVAFTIPSGLEQHYQDVTAGNWYNPYAGIAWQYHLFAGDKDPLSLHPDWLVKTDEAASAIQTFLLMKNEPSDYLEQQITKQQALQHLTLYSIISTRRTNAVFFSNVSSASSSSSSASSVAAPVQPQSVQELRLEILHLVNAARMQIGLLPVRYNRLLENAAQAYADRMAREGFFGHVAPDGQTLRDRIAVTGYASTSFSADCNCVKGFSFGENLGRGQKSAQEVMRDWMNSPAHRAAILNSDYTDLGVGVSAGVWVQEFGGILLPGTKTQ